MLTIFIAVVLKHICRELYLDKKNCRLIEDKYGMHNLDDLLRLESRLENGELGSMVEEIKQKLLVAAKWRRKNPEVDVSEQFCSDVWDDWVESCEGNDASMDAEVEGKDVNVDAEMDVNKDVSTDDAEMNVSLLSMNSYFSFCVD